MFSCEFCDVSKYFFFTEHLWAMASPFWIYEKKVQQGECKWSVTVLAGIIKFTSKIDFWNTDWL